VFREVDAPLCCRTSVVGSTLYIFAYCAYISFSPGSSDSIAASAVCIGSMVVELRRVEVLVLHRRIGRYQYAVMGVTEVGQQMSRGAK
jgi:hypothetical protein